MNIWIYGYMDMWIYGHLDTGIPGYVNTWIPGFLGSKNVAKSRDMQILDQRLLIY